LIDTAAPGTAKRTGHVRPSRYLGSFHIGHIAQLPWIRSFIPIAIGIAAITALVLAVDPKDFGRAIQHFNILLLPAIIAISIGYYVLQGIRWHFLLIEVGIRLRMRDVVLMTLAGQATSLLPLGELTRALLVAEASGGEFGAAVATETVQELIYTLVLIVFAMPGLLQVPHAIGGVVAILIFIAAIFVAMSWCPVYRWLRVGVSKTPMLRRELHDLDELHNDMVLLTRRRSTLTWSWLSVVQAAAMISAFWLIVYAVAPGQLSWQSAALVFAVSNVAGLLSLIPGGIGAYEGSIVGLLIGLGMNGGVAAAVAVLQRVVIQSVATAIGFVSYGVARRRLHISGLGTIPIRSKLEMRTPAPATSSS